VAKERGQEVIDRLVFQSVTKMLLELGTSVYIGDFETPPSSRNTPEYFKCALYLFLVLLSSGRVACLQCLCLTTGRQILHSAFVLTDWPTNNSTNTSLKTIYLPGVFAPKHEIIVPPGVSVGRKMLLGHQQRLHR
jgi:hypothetical protein